MNLYPVDDLALIREKKPSPTEDERAGMKWWNGLSEDERDYWFARAANRASGTTGSVADLWEFCKAGLPISVRQADGHPAEEIFALDAPNAFGDLPDETSIAALATIIREQPILAATRWLTVEAQVRIQRAHLEDLENRLSGLSSRVGA